MFKQVHGLAKRIKQLREGAGLSQQALATAAGLSISVVTQLEQGNRSDPRVSTAAALASALGVTMDEMLAGAADEEAGADSGKKPRRKKGEGGADDKSALSR
jgi:transcriptional regulator with XRE-family HTH domain